jgi:hypothetical protein
MEIPLFLNGRVYENHTVDGWQCVWDKICRMAYEGRDVCESIVTKPGITYVDGKIVEGLSHSQMYSNNDPINHYFLTLENIWKQYSQLYPYEYPKVIPELKELVVPYHLYNCLGVRSWFKHSFPNCVVTYWEQ